MKRYKIHPDIINFIANIYQDDETELHINSEKITDIKITSGIRQGCNGPTLLFLLITYCIITYLEINTRGFCNAICRIAALFFADDGLQFAHSVEDAKTAIKALTTVAKECGLDINKSKSNILIYNMKDSPEEIEGIKITNQIKHLGTVVSNKRNCFYEDKERIFKTANRYMGQTASVAARS